MMPDYARVQEIVSNAIVQAAEEGGFPNEKWVEFMVCALAGYTHGFAICLAKTSTTIHDKGGVEKVAEHAAGLFKKMLSEALAEAINDPKNTQ